jgi:thermolysin
LYEAHPGGVKRSVKLAVHSCLVKRAIALLLLTSAAPAAADSLRPGLVVAAAAEEDARPWAQRIDSLASVGGMSLVSIEDDADLPGHQHLRYTQTVGGVPVFGIQLVRHVDAAGHTLSVFGHFLEDVSADTRPALTAADARRAAEAWAGAGAHGIATPELVLLPLEGRTALVYALWLRHGLDLTRCFIDAVDGRVLLSYSDLQTLTAVGTGTGVWGDRKKLSTTPVAGGFTADDGLRPARFVTYDMRFDRAALDRILDSGVFIPDYVARDADNDWSDGGVVDAHAYAGWTYDYYYKRHGRLGINGANGIVQSAVHFIPVSDGFANAFWYPPAEGMFYGDGDRDFDVFSGALDVVAHELTHGVTQHTWNGTYSGEAGALNEAFSDIMGTSVEFYFQPVGVGRDKADYWLGEDLFRQFAPPVYVIRAMDNPSSVCNDDTGCDPDHYSKLYRGPLDSGGVHHNCAIASHAFYLLIEGGTNRTSGMKVAGLGAANRERAEKIFYRGFTLYLTPSASFRDARAATLRAAADLYGASSNEVAQVAAAWSAVGVN